MPGGLLGWSLRLLSVLLLAPLAIGTFVLALLSLVSLLNASWLALVFVPAALAAGAVSFVLFRGLRASQSQGQAQNGQSWDASIRAELARLPAGTNVRRSRAGKGGILGENPLSTVAIGILIAGLVVAAVVMIGADPAYGDADDATTTIQVAALIVGGAGLIAGVLLAMARDSRGRTVGLRGAAAIPVGLALLVAIGSSEDSSTGPGLSERLVSGLLVLLITGLPVLVGYFAARWFIRFNQARRGVDLEELAGAPKLSPELLAATRRGRAVAFIREYSMDEGGLAFLHEDEGQLSKAGYRKVAENRLEFPRWQNVLGEESRVAVLFVRQGE